MTCRAGEGPAYPVAVAQVTDTHLYADPQRTLKGFDTDRMLRDVLSRVASSRVPADIVLMTGDLVHDGSESGYRRLASHLRRLGLRACCLAGNHDDPAVMDRILPEEGIERASAVALGPWTLVLLDTHVAGTDAGAIGEARLDSLARILAGDGRGPVLIALHHHALPVRSRWIDTLGLRDADSLWTLIGHHPRVRAVVCGHVHQELATEYRGIPVWATPATCMQFAPGTDEFALDDTPPGYRWLTLFPDGSVRTEVVRIAGG